MLNMRWRQEPLCFPVPPGFDDLTAAALPEAMFTVWFNILELGRLQKNEIALIHGGTSGVGSLGIMTLSALGYKVMATCGSAEKCEAARAFGAVAAFDYHAADLAAQIKAETKKAGLPIGVILDMSAGAHLEDDFEVIGFGGRIVHLTPGSSPNLPIRLAKMMAKQIWVTGSRMRPWPMSASSRLPSGCATISGRSSGRRSSRRSRRPSRSIRRREAHAEMEHGPSHRQDHADAEISRRLRPRPGKSHERSLSVRWSGNRSR